MEFALAPGCLHTPADVKIRHWGETEAVAYSGANAKTHVISEAAAHLLLLASGDGLNPSSLAQAFWADDAGAAPTAEDRQLYTDTLNGLLGVGLLTRTP